MNIGPSEYGDSIADVYDKWHDQLAFLNPGPAVKCLAGLAGSGPVLEVGVGTGRIAIPLAARGIQVHGIDISSRMIDRLRAKDVDGTVKATIGDFRTASFDQPFTLIYAAFNTLFSFLGQEEQVSCFENAYRSLVPGGIFVIEAYVPNVRRDEASRLSLFAQVEDGFILEASKQNASTQRIDTQILLVQNAGIRIVPYATRYSWPSELDLMARLTGFQLRNRWAGWTATEFTPSSSDHISIYQR